MGTTVSFCVPREILNLQNPVWIERGNQPGVQFKKEVILKKEERFKLGLNSRRVQKGFCSPESKLFLPLYNEGFAFSLSKLKSFSLEERPKTKQRISWAREKQFTFMNCAQSRCTRIILNI